MNDKVDIIRSSSSEEDNAGQLLKKAIIGIIKNGYDGLTMRQMAILLLTREKQITITNLSKILCVPVPSITKSSDTLEKKNLIRRKKIKKSVYIIATPKGEAVIGKSIIEIIKT